MNEQLMFDEIRELCKVTGLAIDKIAKDCNINQDLVAKMFLSAFQEILNKMQNQK